MLIVSGTLPSTPVTKAEQLDDPQTQVVFELQEPQLPLRHAARTARWGMTCSTAKPLSARRGLTARGGHLFQDGNSMQVARRQQPSNTMQGATKGVVLVVRGSK